MKENFTEKFKQFFSSEESLKRVPIYLFLICVFLVILIFRLGETNHHLKEIAANGTNVIEIKTKDDDYESVADIYIETKKNAEDIVPILDVLTEENTEDSTNKESHNNSEENTTKTVKDESSTKVSSTTTTTQSEDNENAKTAYVLNISSKKIHLADCSFVKRTKEENKKYVELTDKELQEYFDNGYVFCKTCGGD